MYCTKDTCANHLCERCHRCSDCCLCETPVIRGLETAAEPEKPPVVLEEEAFEDDEFDEDELDDDELEEADEPAV